MANVRSQLNLRILNVPTVPEAPFPSRGQPAPPWPRPSHLPQTIISAHHLFSSFSLSSPPAAVLPASKYLLTHLYTSPSTTTSKPTIGLQQLVRNSSSMFGLLQVDLRNGSGFHTGSDRAGAEEGYRKGGRVLCREMHCRGEKKSESREEREMWSIR